MGSPFTGCSESRPLPQVPGGVKGFRQTGEMAPAGRRIKGEKRRDASSAGQSSGRGPSAPIGPRAAILAAGVAAGWQGDALETFGIWQVQPVIPVIHLHVSVLGFGVRALRTSSCE